MNGVPARPFMTQLEGLRGVAILLVMVSHFGLGSQLSALTDALSLQGLGVRAFFVLSGFLVCRQLLRVAERVREGQLGARAALRDFWVRKSVRLYPVYFLAIGILVALDFQGFREVALWNALFLGNFDFVRFSDIASSGDLRHAASAHLWSLALQEQFYLLFPALLLLVSGRPLVYLLLAMVVAAPVWRFYWLFVGDPTYPHENMMLLPACLDTLVLGALLALYQQNYHGLRDLLGRWVRPACYLAATFMLLFLYSRYTGTGTRLIQSTYDLPYALCVAAIIKFAADGRDYPFGRLLDMPLLRFLGRVSYGTYVFHTFAPHIVRYAAPHFGIAAVETTALWAPLLFALSILMGWAAWALVERPVVALRDTKRKRAPAVLAPSPGTARQ